LEFALFHAVVVSGHAEVLAQSSLLEGLAARCDQAGAMNWLGYFLEASSFKNKKPYLVLITKFNTSTPRLDDVYAAVLLFEYRVMGFPTRAFSTDDWAGFRTVIAPEAEQAAVSALAAEALFARGAQIVLISFLEACESTSTFVPAMGFPAMWVSGKRPVAMTLHLEPTVSATLAKLGKSTRFNLGYYRRRLQAAEPCELVDDVCGLMSDAELQALNQASLNPVELDDFRLQVRSACNLPGGFMLGLRSLKGRWLSLIGGWRQGNVTVLHWQLNAAGYEKLSIGTAMRSYFLEHEVARGTTKLIYYGGTPHSMGNSFECEQVTDLIVRRRSLRSAALYAVMRMLAALRPHVGINSLLVQMLGSGQLHWRLVERTSAAARPQEARP
jgi:hypothetical protein